MPTGCIHSSSSQPMSVSGSPTVVISQSNTGADLAVGEGEVARLRVAVHQRDRRMRLRHGGAQFGQQSFEAGNGPV